MWACCQNVWTRISSLLRSEMSGPCMGKRSSPHFLEEGPAHLADVHTLSFSQGLSGSYYYPYVFRAHTWLCIICSVEIENSRITPTTSRPLARLSQHCMFSLSLSTMQTLTKYCCSLWIYALEITKEHSETTEIAHC